MIDISRTNGEVSDREGKVVKRDLASVFAGDDEVSEEGGWEIIKAGTRVRKIVVTTLQGEMGEYRR
jgi:hypothetical protein